MGKNRNAYKSPVYSGKPGTVWTNTTGTILYQLVCDLSHVCGTCLQFHMQIGASWPIPFHRFCRCRQILLQPGEDGLPFADFRQVLDGLTSSQKRDAIGKSNYSMLRSCLISWDDVVSPTRVRTLQEIAWKKKLTVDEMVRAGVQPRWAKQAYAASRTASQTTAAAERASLIAKLRNSGISEHDMRDAIKRGIAERISISGPSGGQTLFLTKPKPTPGGGLGGITPVGLGLPESKQADLIEALFGKAPKTTPKTPAVKTKPSSFAVGVSGFSRVEKEMTETLKLIDSVHGTPESLPNIPVIIKDEMRYLGALVLRAEEEEVTIGGRTLYMPTGRLVPVEIRMHRFNGSVRNTTAHEFGHYLDYSAIPKAVPGHDREFAADPIMAAWKKAVDGSEAIKSVMSQRSQYAGKDKRTLSDQDAYQQWYFDYISTYEEIWARSYAQWIATKSKDPQMTDEILRHAGKEQWSPDDFEPIAEAFDGIFRGLGLLKE